MASIKDVARLAGVSPSTVSLAMNGSPLVKLETRYRIMQAVEELNYKPNQAARSLVTREKRIIGLFRMSGNDRFVDDNPFGQTIDSLLTEMLPFVQARLRDSNYSLLLDMFYSLNPSPAETQGSSIFDRNIIDGAIFFGGMIGECQADEIKKAQIPSVLVCARDKMIDYVDTDPETGIYLAVNYLISQGHRRIALINGPRLSQVSEPKLAGYRKSLAEHGIPFSEALVEFSDYSGEMTIQAMERLWAREPHPTAVIGASGHMGCAILRFFHDREISCPRDVSVISYENGPIPAYAAPPLTSIDIHKRQLAEEAANILLNRLKNPKARHVGLIIPPELVIRGSVRPIELSGSDCG